MFVVLAQVAHGFEQGRPIDAVRAHRQQAEHDQQLVEAGEGGQIKPQAAGADQAQRDEFAGVKAVRKIAAENEQCGGDNGVGTEQRAEFGMAQAHVLLNGDVEGVLEVGEFVDGPATQNQHQKTQPFGFGLSCHRYSPSVN